jgi:hypothetical protein
LISLSFFLPLPKTPAQTSQAKPTNRHDTHDRHDAHSSTTQAKSQLHQGLPANQTQTTNNKQPNTSPPPTTQSVIRADRENKARDRHLGAHHSVDWSIVVGLEYSVEVPV